MAVMTSKQRIREAAKQISIYHKDFKAKVDMTIKEFGLDDGEKAALIQSVMDRSK